MSAVPQNEIALRGRPRVKVVLRYLRVLHIHATECTKLSAYPQVLSAPPPDSLPIYRHLRYNPSALLGWVDSCPAFMSQESLAKIIPPETTLMINGGQAAWRLFWRPQSYTTCRDATRVSARTGEVPTKEP